MLKLSQDTIKDPYGKVVGFVKGDRFTQTKNEHGKVVVCDSTYNYLSWMELEQISELLQKKR